MKGIEDSSGVVLRPRRDGDEDFLSRLYASTRAEELAPVPWSEADKEAFLRQQFEAQTTDWDARFPEAQFSIIEDEGEAVGRLYLDRRPDEIRIVDIALLPERRGRGIGGRLLKAVLGEAAENGLAVRIHVERNNPALRLYERLGFEVIGDTGVYLLMEKST